MQKPLNPDVAIMVFAQKLDAMVEGVMNSSFRYNCPNVGARVLADELERKATELRNRAAKYEGTSLQRVWRAVGRDEPALRWTDGITAEAV